MSLLRDDDAVAEIARRAGGTDASASSHWREMHEGFSYRDGKFSGLRGFGGALTPRGPLHALAHRLLQRPLRALGAGLRRFAEFDAALAAAAKRQGRIYDQEMLRQALVLARVLEFGELPAGPAAVIGDGFGSLSTLMLSALPGSKVVAVNLAKTLLTDVLYCRAALPGLRTALAVDAASYLAALADPETRLVALCADDAELLGAAPLGSAFNVASMQEMDPPVIARYFALLRRARTGLFYCCNREEKRLPDGTVTRFAEYSWSLEDRVLLDELCPWHDFYYLLRPPFYFSYDGPVRHRLARLASA